jgi:anti-sigma factor ChrR (cupin superfamily)
VKAEPSPELAEYLLGMLPEAEAAEVRARLAELQREADEIGEALAQVASALPAVTPSMAARARLVDSLSGPDRFRPFFAELERRFDLTVQSLRALLARVDDAEAWEATPLPGVKLIHFAGGPGLAGADAGFVRVAAGTTFPRHSHGGPELNFILEGQMLIGQRVLGPGDSDEAAGDVIHEYQAGADADLVLMVWHHGVTLLDG